MIVRNLAESFAAARFVANKRTFPCMEECTQRRGRVVNVKMARFNGVGCSSGGKGLACVDASVLNKVAALLKNLDICDRVVSCQRMLSIITRISVQPCHSPGRCTETLSSFLKNPCPIAHHRHRHPHWGDYQMGGQ